MHRFRLGLQDLAAASFACSPIHEAVLSLRMWTHPGVYVHQTRSFERIRPEFERLDTALLRSLVASNRFIADFLTPRPTAPFPDFHAELAVVRALPPERLHAEFAATYLPHDREIPSVLAAGLDDPAALLARISDAVEEYWERCLAPEWWPRARSVLQADMVHRSRALAERGAAAVFADLDGRMSWSDGPTFLSASREFATLGWRGWGRDGSHAGCLQWLRSLFPLSRHFFRTADWALRTIAW